MSQAAVVVEGSRVGGEAARSCDLPQLMFLPRRLAEAAAAAEPTSPAAAGRGSQLLGAAARAQSAALRPQPRWSRRRWKWEGGCIWSGRGWGWRRGCRRASEKGCWQRCWRGCWLPTASCELGARCRAAAAAWVLLLVLRQREGTPASLAGAWWVQLPKEGCRLAPWLPPAGARSLLPPSQETTSTASLEGRSAARGEP